MSTNTSINAAPCPRHGCTWPIDVHYSSLIDGWLAQCPRHGTGSEYAVTPADAVAKWDAWATAALAKASPPPCR